jgi:hypothetical protein
MSPVVAVESQDLAMKIISIFSKIHALATMVLPSAKAEIQQDINSFASWIKDSPNHKIIWDNMKAVSGAEQNFLLAKQITTDIQNMIDSLQAKYLDIINHIETIKPKI